METGDRKDDLSASSSDEDEDENGILALGVLDEQVRSTLEAIRKKDPRVYDANVKFFDDLDDGTEEATGNTPQKDKPLYLSDYHRKNLLEGGVGPDDDDEIPPKTYQEQQAELKQSIVKEVHATADGVTRDEDIDCSIEEDFLVEKVVQSQGQSNATHVIQKVTNLDVESADKDPERYLSNFMSTKGWVTSGNSTIHPFESDDDEQDRRADAFEEAYNLRFEDPKASNEKMLSHARDAAAKYSVRKEEINPRKRKRDLERERKGAEKELQSEEKARLRKLKVADLQVKLEKIKDAAGWKNEHLPEEEWLAFLGDAWDDDQWEREMKNRFGDAYYNKHDVEGEDDDQGSKKRISKPRWKNDIDINDIVPSFEGDNEGQDPPFELSDTDVDAKAASRKLNDSKKTKLKAEQDKRKRLHSERRKIEQLVDEQLDIDETLAELGKKHAGTFRYRDTSPLTLGLTAHDILMADDSQLNQFAGLKKLATFREPDKKKKDKKLLGKRQRIKQWRKETFGNEHGPTEALAEVLARQRSRDGGWSNKPPGEGDVTERERKKKRSRKLNKSKVVA